MEMSPTRKEQFERFLRAQRKHEAFRRRIRKQKREREQRAAVIGDWL
jgi:hypothetical protein